MSKTVNSFSLIIVLAFFFCSPVHSQTEEKQRSFEWVFGDLVKLDPAMVQKVLNDTHGKRHYVDKDGDGKPEEVWFIDISPRHSTVKRPVLVRVIDENGNLRMGEEPDYAGYLYIADWNADGLVDAVIEYKDLDGDSDLDEMAMFFYDPNYRALRAWWGRDDGDDNLLWYDIDYYYYQEPCQDFTHFGGDETFFAFYIQPGDECWTPFFENPFLFYDHDGDGVTEEVIRVSGKDNIVHSLRHSFDLDNNATIASPRNFDVSLSAYAPGWTLEQGVPPYTPGAQGGSHFTFTLDANQTEILTIRGKQTLPVLKRKVAETLFNDVVWSRALMTWDENDLNIGRYGPPIERWEGIIAAPSTDKGFEFPVIGGPDCGLFNKRYELVLNPASANEYYFSPSDSRIHIKYSDRTWIKVDYDYDQKIDMYYLWTDTNKDGILDKIEVDVDGDSIFDDSWKLDVSTIQPVLWNFKDLNNIYAPVIVNESPLVYQLNRMLEKAIKTILPNAGKAPAWEIIEKKMQTVALTQELSERLLHSDASILFYMRIAADYEIVQLKKAYKNKTFWQKFDVARGRNDLTEMIRLLNNTFKLSMVTDLYSDWVSDLREKPQRKKTAWDNTWLPPNWGWESEKAAFRFYDGRFDLFVKRMDTLIYPDAVRSKDSYHKDHNTWGMDVLHVDETGGCGGLILYVDDIAYPVRRKDDGAPVFTGRLLKETSDTISLEFTATGVGPADASYTVYIKVSAIAGRYDSPVELRVEGANERSLKIGIGLNVLSTERYFMDKSLGIMGIWGFQDPETGWIGTGIIFPEDRFLYTDEQPDEHRVVLKYNAGETVRYHIQGDWLRAHQFPVAPGVREWKEKLTKTAIKVNKTRRIEVPTWYYTHFGADYRLEVPAEGFGGWEKTELPFSPEHTALCVMHAWDNPDPDSYPGLYSSVEYLPRAEEILNTRMPSLLKAFREAGIRVIHIESGNYVNKYEAYWQTQDIIREPLSKSRKASDFAMPNPAPDQVYQELSKFRVEHIFPGIQNSESSGAAALIRDIHANVRPLPGEYMLTDSDELQAICAIHGINHLIYVGFALNCCLLMSPGGMIDMSRRGFICSTVKEATTAVENDFSSRNEFAKQLALWNTALFFGFVYEQADLEKALKNVRK